VRVWKLNEEKTCEEYQSKVKHKVAEAEWKCIDVNEHWQQMKNILMDTAQVTCGLSKGPCRHKETWWWNEEVAETEKRIKVGKKKKTEWWDAGVVICLGRGADLHVAQLMPLLLNVSCSSKSQLVLPFWYQLTRVVPDKVQGGGHKTVVVVVVVYCR